VQWIVAGLFAKRGWEIFYVT